MISGLCSRPPRPIASNFFHSITMMLSSRPLRLDGQTYNISTAKTPGRAILKGRSALQENAFQNGSMTGNAKGKKVVLHTPFHPQTLRELSCQPYYTPIESSCIRTAKIVQGSSAPRPFKIHDRCTNPTARRQNSLHKPHGPSCHSLTQWLQDFQVVR